ncbi:DUF2786 domain-containing protein [Streptomyces sp. A5-4]|uniref:DUF2786 domain-containing protein n=1 Tax=Streptomyces sp. A5-4 TaxID=3384771 RepID=UPI003DA9282B
MSVPEGSIEAVDKAFAAALYTDGDAGLDIGASLLAADPDADAELRRRGEEFVTRAWQRGWQPADVERIVRRDLAEHHVRLVGELIAGEVRVYGRLPPRWDAQLAELDVRQWRADRFSYATAVLELLRVLLRLPAVEPVGAAPGAAVHVPSRHDGEPRMLTRIRALLAKAEATDFPQEAEALTGKAQELMARHSIDEALLAAQGHTGDTPAACRIGVDAPYETAKAILLNAVADANRCRAVWNGDLGFSTVVGFETDLESVELLHTSLLVQGTAAMTRAEAAQRAGGRKRTKAFRQSFLTAYASRMGDRLHEATEHVTEEAGGSLLPVLAARDVAVEDRTDRMFPETTPTRVRGVTDYEGWEHGTAAADRAHLPKSHRPEHRPIRPGD